MATVQQQRDRLRNNQVPTPIENRRLSININFTFALGVI